MRLFLKKMHCLCLVFPMLCFCFWVAAVDALAEKTLGAGLSIQSSPYKSTSVAWDPIPLLAYEGNFFYVRGTRAGFKAFSSETLELSAFLRYDAMSFTSADSDDGGMRRLDNRHSSMSGGVAAQVITPAGMLYGNLAMDLLGNSKGFMADVGFGQSWEFGAMEILPRAGARFYDQRYNRYYYGISESEARTSGLSRYRPDGGVEPYAGLSFDYSLSEALEVLAGAEASLLSREARNSPMVDKEGTVDFYFGLTYSF